ncbi:MAG: eCIS core domain-containing protein [Myxococcota bacterium]
MAKDRRSSPSSASRERASTTQEARRSSNTQAAALTAGGVGSASRHGTAPTSDLGLSAAHGSQSFANAVASRDAAGSGAGLDTSAAAALIEQSQGTPLSAEVAARLGAQLGADVSGAVVHTDGAAAEAAAALQANAFAMGHHVYFASGMYRPGTPEGDTLIAHEIAHVLQAQAGQIPTGSGQGLEVSRPDQPHEVAAAAMGDAVAQALHGGGALEASPFTGAAVGGGAMTGGASLASRDEAPAGDGATATQAQDGVPEQVAALLSRTVFDPVVSDDDAREAFRLIAASSGKATIWSHLDAEGLGNRLWEELPKDELTYNFDTTLSVMQSLSGGAQQQHIIELLSFSMTDWSVDEREAHMVVLMMSTWTEAQREAFISVDGGTWFARLVGAVIPGTTPATQGAEPQSWGDWLSETWTNGCAAYDAFVADPAATLDRIKAGGRMAWDFLSGLEVNLNDAQELAGGSLAGMTMDTTADNIIDVDVGTEVCTVTIDDLGIASLHHEKNLVKIHSGPMSVKKLRAEVGTTAGKPGIHLSIGRLEASDLAMEYIRAHTAIQIGIGALLLDALQLDMTPPESIKPDEAEGSIASLLNQHLGVTIGRTMAAPIESMKEMIVPTDDLTNAFSTPLVMNDVSLSLGSASLNDVVLREQQPDGSWSEVARIGSAAMEGLVATSSFVNTRDVLQEELTRLTGPQQPEGLGAEAKARVEWLVAEIERLDALILRVDALQQKASSGELSIEEREELVLAQNELQTRTVTVNVGQADLEGATYDGKTIEDAHLENASATVTGEIMDLSNELTPSQQAAADRQAFEDDKDRLDHVIDRRTLSPTDAAAADAQRREDKAARTPTRSTDDLLDGTLINASVGEASIEQQGITVAGASVEAGSVSGAQLAVHGSHVGASAESGQLQGATYEKDGTTVRVEQVDAQGLDAYTDGTNHRGRADAIQGAGASYAADGSTAEAASFSVTDVTGTSDGTTHHLTTETARADGVAYTSGSTQVSADTLTGEGIDASMNGSSIDGSVRSAEVTNGRYVGDGRSASVGHGTATGLQAGMDDNGYHASIDTMSGTNLKGQYGEYEATATSASADGLVMNANSDMSTMHVGLDAVEAHNVKGSDGGSMQGGAAVATGTGLTYATTGDTSVMHAEQVTGEKVYGATSGIHAQAGSVTVDEAMYISHEDGTSTGSFEHLHATDAYGEYSSESISAQGSVDEFSVGHTRATMDEDGNVVSAESNDIEGLGIQVKVVYNAGQASEASSERSLTDQLAEEEFGAGDARNIQASFHGKVPLMVTLKDKTVALGDITFRGQAIDGVVDINDIDLDCSIFFDGVVHAIMKWGLIEAKLTEQGFQGIRTKTRNNTVNLEELAASVGTMVVNGEFTASEDTAEEDSDWTEVPLVGPLSIHANVGESEFYSTVDLRDTEETRIGWDSANVDVGDASGITIWTGVVAPVTDDQEAARHGVNASARMLTANSCHVVGPDGETIDATTTGIEGFLVHSSYPLADEVTLEMTLDRFTVKHVEMHK